MIGAAGSGWGRSGPARTALGTPMRVWNFPTDADVSFLVARPESDFLLDLRLEAVLMRNLPILLRAHGGGRGASGFLGPRELTLQVVRLVR